jgi:hypothetical protein
MKALGVLQSKWDPIRKKLVRRLLERGDRGNCKGREHVRFDMYVEEGARADCDQETKSSLSREHGNWLFFVV